MSLELPLTSMSGNDEERLYRSNLVIWNPTTNSRGPYESKCCVNFA